MMRRCQFVQFAKRKNLCQICSAIQLIVHEQQHVQHLYSERYVFLIFMRSVPRKGKGGSFYYAIETYWLFWFYFHFDVSNSKNSSSCIFSRHSFYENYTYILSFRIRRSETDVINQTFHRKWVIIFLLP